MSKQLTPEQQQRQAEDIMTTWRLTRCPKGLLDPTTNTMHAKSIQVLQEYFDEHNISAIIIDTLKNATELFGTAIKAVGHKMVWFSDPPSKPKELKPPPKYEPPLQLHDKRRVEREFREGQEKLRQEAQKAIDKALKKQEEAKADERPGAIYYESGPRAGKIDWAETKKRQDLWDAQHWLRSIPS